MLYDYRCHGTAVEWDMSVGPRSLGSILGVADVAAMTLQSVAAPGRRYHSASAAAAAAAAVAGARQVGPTLRDLADGIAESLLGDVEAPVGPVRAAAASALVLAKLEDGVHAIAEGKAAWYRVQLRQTNPRRIESLDDSPMVLRRRRRHCCVSILPVADAVPFSFGRSWIPLQRRWNPAQALLGAFRFSIRRSLRRSC